MDPEPKHAIDPGGDHGGDLNEEQKIAERALANDPKSPFADLREVQGAGEAGATPSGQNIDLKKN